MTRLTPFFALLALTLFPHAGRAHPVGEVPGGPPGGAEWRSVLHHDETGTILDGSFEALLDAIEGGADVRVAFPATNGRVTAECDVVRTFPDEGIVSCQATPYISTTAAADGPSFGAIDDPYILYNTFNTRGRRDISRWFIRTQLSAGHTQDPAELEWYVRP